MIFLSILDHHNFSVRWWKFCIMLCKAVGLVLMWHKQKYCRFANSTANYVCWRYLQSVTFLCSNSFICLFWTFNWTKSCKTFQFSFENIDLSFKLLIIQKIKHKVCIKCTERFLSLTLIKTRVKLENRGFSICLSLIVVGRQSLKTAFPNIEIEILTIFANFWQNFWTLV